MVTYNGRSLVKISAVLGYQQLVFCTVCLCITLTVLWPRLAAVGYQEMDGVGRWMRSLMEGCELQ